MNFVSRVRYTLGELLLRASIAVMGDDTLTYIQKKTSIPNPLNEDDYDADEYVYPAAKLNTRALEMVLDGSARVIPVPCELVDLPLEGSIEARIAAARAKGW